MRSSEKKKSLGMYSGLIRLIDYCMNRFMNPYFIYDQYRDRNDPYDVHVERNVKRALEKQWLNHKNEEASNESDLSVKIQRTVKKMIQISRKSLRK